MSYSYPEAPSTPTPSSRKRSHGNMHDDDEQTRLLGSQKRLKIIEQAIKEQNTPSASSQTHTVNSPIVPTTPGTPTTSRPYRKFNPSSSQNSAAVPSGSKWLSTPQSSQESLGPSSQTFRSASTNSGPTAPPHDTTTNTSAHDNTATSGNLLVEDVPDEELTADSIAAVIQRLGIQIPNYIRKLERKKLAAEKSRESRDNKIAFQQTQIENLEKEVERLKAREKELEDVIAAYEQE